MSDVEVRNNPAQNRYEAWIGEELVGFAEYGMGPSTVVFIHTEVAPQFEGRGVGGALAKGALEDIRAGGEYDVIPLCPFIKGYLEKHPEYADLVHHRG